MKILPKIALFAGGVIFGGGLDIAARVIRNKKWSKNFGYLHAPSEYVKPTIKFDDPVFDSMHDALDVIEEMRNIVRIYGYVNYATLCEVCGRDIWLWQKDRDYGWVSVEGFKLRVVPDKRIMGTYKYRLCLPKAININNLEF